MSDSEPLTDAELAQLEADLEDKNILIAELQTEAADLTRQIIAEYKRRAETDGDVVKFRPRPSNGPGDRMQPVSDRAIRNTVYGVAALVAVFAFVVSYAHIYDLARGHGQHGVAAKAMPLSVDMLIVAASLMLFLQSRASERAAGLARLLPRLLLWAGIGATIGANIAYGWPYGWLGAAISAWPGAVFAGLVEMVMVTARPKVREAVKGTVIAAAKPLVPATAVEAARTAFEASAAAGNPLGPYTLAARFGIPRSQANKICRPAVTAAALNGQGPHE